ncbi:3-hydroxyisobutyrate dehydrogenase-like beta-hydroxyacid dehydrogenase [Streptomonospora salina]|uniref:3-hydroxyisobutyrate dehydrogenase-like beta-hydroxyacid dehydrogenase n=2 Tax=Streptomonospora salina TaxID=104205 RepID=A0A841E7L6_9ACTN|nr:3-hydroxyisobutyrate dehydrogenase-like beta-hydroxyacid dehydrogenase [Streptomonospora salina]
MRRAEEAGLEPRSLAELVETSEVVLSLVPPAQAEAAADAVQREGFDGVYVEANAIRPGRVEAIASKLPHSQVVDACVIGPPPVDRTPAVPTRFFASGPEDLLSRIGDSFADTAVEFHALGPQVGRASGLKMAQSTVQKGSRMLAALGHALAADYGVGEALTDSVEGWAHPASDPAKLPALAGRAWRWEPEMRDTAQALDESGLPPGAITAIADALKAWEPFKDRTDIDLHDILAALHNLEFDSDQETP